MKKKLISRKGESLVETLAALLVITLTFVFLVNSITKASELKKKTDSYDQPFTYSPGPQSSITVTVKDGYSGSGTAQLYVCKNEKNEGYSYYYYTAAEPES